MPYIPVQAVAGLRRRMMDFKNKVLIIGYGAVCKCMLPILLRHVNIPLDHITIIDFKDKSADLKAWTAGGLTLLQKEDHPEEPDRGPLGILIPGWPPDRCCLEHRLLRGCPVVP